MFGMAIVAVLFFMVAGPLSFIITIPMIVFAGLAKAQEKQQHIPPARSGYRPQREWKMVSDGKGGHKLIRDHEKEK